MPPIVVRLLVFHTPSGGRALFRGARTFAGGQFAMGGCLVVGRGLFVRVCVVTTRPRRLLAMGGRFIKEPYIWSGDRTVP